MSDSSTVISRFVVVLFFAAAGLGIYSVVTHNRLQAAEQRLSRVEQERTDLKERLVTTERSVAENSAAAKTCAAEMESYKSRAEDAENALKNTPRKKGAPSHSSAG